MEYNHEEWVKLVSQPKKHGYCDKTTFVARIAEVCVKFKTVEGTYLIYRLVNAMSIFSKFGFKYYVSASIPDVTSTDFMIYEEGWVVPDEFIREYVNAHTHTEIS